MTKRQKDLVSFCAARAAYLHLHPNVRAYAPLTLANGARLAKAALSKAFR